MRAAPLISCALLILSTLLGSGTAGAFCRSTTCSDDDCPRDDAGCKTTGQPLSWTSGCVGFSIQKDGTANLPMSRVREVIADSFVSWSSLGCDGGEASIAFSELADASCHQAEFNSSGPNANVVMFQDDRWHYTGIDDTLAKTTVSYNTQTGEIWDADIELNFAYNELTVGDGRVVYDLQSILTHEIGHFIGLDHSLEDDATMNADYMMGTISQRTLATDDIAGACAIYPAGRDANCVTTPRGGFVSACTGDPADAKDGGCSFGAGDAGGAAGAAFFALAIAIAGLRIKRRRRALAIGGLVAAAAVFAASCGSDDPKLCDPDSNIFCRCPDGEAGSKTCNAAGTAFSACTLQSTGEACPSKLPCSPGDTELCNCPDAEPGLRICGDDGQGFGACLLQTSRMPCPLHPSTSSSGGGGAGGSGAGGAGGSGGSGGAMTGGGGSGGGPLGACPGTATTVSTANDTTLAGDTSQGADREHDRCGGTGAPDLAYEVTPASSGTLTVTANGIGATNPVLYARTGDCETGVSLGCRDATSGGGTEVLTLEAVSGTPIWVFVDGASGTSGQFSLNFHLSGGVPGDTCSGVPIAIGAGETVTAGGDTSIAMADYKGTGACAASGTREIVYAVKPAADGSLTVKLTPAFDAQLYARSGSCPSSTSGTQLGCSDNLGAGVPETIVFAVTSGTTYSVFADGAPGESGPYTISFKLQ